MDTSLSAEKQTETASAPSVQSTPTTPSKTWEQLTSAEREELKALSKEVFGASSRAKKLIDRGYTELLTEMTTEYVPGKTLEDGTVEDGTTREVQVPLKRNGGALQSTTKHHTVDSIRAYMLERKAAIDKIRAQIKQQQEEARAKKEKEELAKKVHEHLQGSAV